MAQDKDFPLHEIISRTTRPLRQGEVDGVNYHFVSIGNFVRDIQEGKMLEAAEFRGWHYGTSLDDIEPKELNIGVFNPTGIASLTENPMIDVLVLEVVADDKTRMLRQLNREKDPDVKEIVRRFKTDEDDFVGFEDKYHSHIIDNCGGRALEEVGAEVLTEIARWYIPLG